MKHPSSREFFAYWDEKRGGARAPDRSEIEPSPSYSPEGAGEAGERGVKR